MKNNSHKEKIFNWLSITLLIICIVGTFLFVSVVVYSRKRDAFKQQALELIVDKGQLLHYKAKYDKCQNLLEDTQLKLFEKAFKRW